MQRSPKMDVRVFKIDLFKEIVEKFANENFFLKTIIHSVLRIHIKMRTF